MELQIKINETKAGFFVVVLKGPLDTTTFSSFEKTLNRILVSTTKAIVLDMGGVNYISSLGVGSVFKAVKTMNQHKGSLVVINLQPQIKKVFEIAKLLPDAVFKNIKEADEYLDQIQRKIAVERRSLI